MPPAISRTHRKILLVGNCHQLSGNPRWVLLLNLAPHLAGGAPDCKIPVRATTAGAQEVFTRDDQSSYLLLDSVQYQFSRDVVSGYCLVSGHVSTQSVFFLNISSMDEAGVPPNVPTSSDGSQPAGSMSDSVSPNKALHFCWTVLCPSIKHYL